MAAFANLTTMDRERSRICVLSHSVMRDIAAFYDIEELSGSKVLIGRAC